MNSHWFWFPDIFDEHSYFMKFKDKHKKDEALQLNASDNTSCQAHTSISGNPYHKSSSLSMNTTWYVATLKSNFELNFDQVRAINCFLSFIKVLEVGEELT